MEQVHVSHMGNEVIAHTGLEIVIDREVDIVSWFNEATYLWMFLSQLQIEKQDDGSFIASVILADEDAFLKIDSLADQTSKHRKAFLDRNPALDYEFEDRYVEYKLDRPTWVHEPYPQS